MAFTYFFRDLQTLEMIRDHALPKLRSNKFIHIWDAGCAMGPEPYSLAIVLRENMGRMIFRNVKIHATDIDGSNLFGKIIGDGAYPHEQVQRIPKDLFATYFQRVDDSDNYVLSDDIRKSVSFHKHDLLTLEPPRDKMSLIICKNVLLHFNQAQRIEVIRMFHDVLIDGGYFATEQTQKMPEELNGMFEQVVSNTQLFRKVA